MKSFALCFCRNFVLVLAGCASLVIARAGESQAFTRTIYLVRHGNYDSSAVPSDDGGNLNSLGLAQARLVAARLRGLPVTFTSLTASTMPRAKQTAMVIGQTLSTLSLQTSPLLRECTPQTWRKDVTEKEKLTDLQAAEKQLDEGFAKFFVPAVGADQYDVLVCHGNVIRYFVMKALKVDTQAWLGLSVAHCSLTVIQVKPDGGFRVTAVGDIGHVPPNLQSGAVPGQPPKIPLP